MKKKEQRSETINKFEEEIRQFFNEGKYEDARETCQKFIETSKDAQDKILEATALGQYAMVYAGTGNFKEGIQRCREALLSFKEAEDEGGVAYTLFNLGNIHYMMKDVKTALLQYNEALNIFHQIQDQQRWALVAHQLGRVYQGLEDWDRAASLYQKALDIFRKSEQRDFMVKVLGGLGQVYARMGKTELAFDFSAAALTLCLEINDPNAKLAIKDIYDLFCKVGEKDFKELWNSTVKGITLKEIMNIFSEITYAEEAMAEEKEKC